ncbi:N-acetyltransferase [Lachnospiraceae bacterium 46-61]
MITIRNEKKSDYKKVEEITRKAFYNLYIPGCVEHYLVHIMRNHKDFIPELDFVIEKDGEIIGNIMYTKSKLVEECGKEKQIITFGPVCILPEYQRMGYGKMLLEYSFTKALEIGYDAIVIFGSPSNYVNVGFQCCKKYHVCTENGKYPTAMLVKELKQNTLQGKKWTYYDSPIMNIDVKDAERFDEHLEKMDKKYQTSQEEFYIYSHSFIE